MTIITDLEEDELINSLLLGNNNNNNKLESILITEEEKLEGKIEINQIKNNSIDLNSLRIKALTSKKRNLEEDNKINKKLKLNSITNESKMKLPIKDEVEEMEEGEIIETTIIIEDNELEEIEEGEDLDGIEVKLLPLSNNSIKDKGEGEESGADDDDDDVIIVDSTASTSNLESSIPPPAPLKSLELDLNVVKEEAKNIISQLLGFGVTPDYLIQYGVSEDIIGIAFYELGYRLPPHLNHLTPTNLPPLQQYLPPQSSQRQQFQSSQQQLQQQRFNEIVSPRSLPFNLPTNSITNENYISSHQALKAKVAGLEIENRKRSELLARKAANKDAAEKAVSFLDDLFSAPTTTPTTVSTLDSSIVTSTSGRSTSNHSPIESNNYNGSEISTSSNLITSHPRLSSVQEGKRAVAIDYLNSVPSLPNFNSSSRHSTNGNSSSSFASIDFAQSRIMIIDISDDEESDYDEDDEGVGGVGENNSGLNGGSSTITSTRLILPTTSSVSLPNSLLSNSNSTVSNLFSTIATSTVQLQPQLSKSSPKLSPQPTTALPPSSTSTPTTNPINPLLPPLPLPLPSPALSTTPSSTSTPNATGSNSTPSAERQLWEKELEIRKIMLRIANMEKKKFERSLVNNGAGAGGAGGSRGVSREGSVMVDDGKKI